MRLRDRHARGVNESQSFGYDHVFDQSTSQEQLFETIGRPVLEKALDGFNGTIFAYGQTGSGKTHCMMGECDGIIPQLSSELFRRIQGSSANHKKFLVQCSFFEIYNEVVYDLLGARRRSEQPQGLEVREDKALGVFVKGLQEIVVDSEQRMLQLIEQGNVLRTCGSTSMNEHSSRSHSVFQVRVHQKDLESKTSVFAKINLVDLAGSERAARTGATGARLTEGANINQSLSALGNVINALAEVSRTGKRLFVPFRNSKLTRVLQESLGGNSLTSMLATVSPCSSSFEETVSTLRYADRAKVRTTCRQ